ncbi:MAG TPA: hypothetical protein VJL59_02720 [Anaerolineales bacterium]|nr:hypothetical protein [Anaerolineales bacterium]
MGTYGLDSVLTAWKQGKITAEQAVGQILQLLKELDDRLTELEALVYPARPAVKNSVQKAHSNGG